MPSPPGAINDYSERRDLLPARKGNKNEEEFTVEHTKPEQVETLAECGRKKPTTTPFFPPTGYQHPERKTRQDKTRRRRNESPIINYLTTTTIKKTTQIESLHPPITNQPKRNRPSLPTSVAPSKPDKSNKQKRKKKIPSANFTHPGTSTATKQRKTLQNRKPCLASPFPHTHTDSSHRQKPRNENLQKHNNHRALKYE